MAAAAESAAAVTTMRAATGGSEAETGATTGAEAGATTGTESGTAARRRTRCCSRPSQLYPLLVSLLLLTVAATRSELRREDPPILHAARHHLEAVVCYREAAFAAVLVLGLHSELECLPTAHVEAFRITSRNAGSMILLDT